MQPVEKNSVQYRPWLRIFPLLAGALTVLLGAFVVTAWHAHSMWSPQQSPNMLTTQYNTALVFIFCGVALILLAVSRPGLVPFFGGLAALFGALTLLEYGLGWTLGIDQLFLTNIPRNDSAFPGRMSPLTAINFVFIGFGLLIAVWQRSRPQRLAWAGLLSCVPINISLVVLFGFALGVDATSGWGDFTRISIYTAVGFELMGTGLLAWSWRQSRIENLEFTRWIPLVSSVTLLAMVGLVSIVSLSQLNTAVLVRGDAYAVLGRISALAENIADVQRGMRGYILTGEAAALTTYQHGTNAVVVEVAELNNLTGRNARQRRLVRRITTDVGKVVDYSVQLLSTNQAAGISAAVQLEKTGQGLRLMDRVLGEFREYRRYEQVSLDVRDWTVGVDLENVWKLLGLGVIIAGGLLIFSNSLAGREIQRRRRAELAAESLNEEFRATTALQNAILQSANYSVVATTVEGIVTLFNSTSERWLGYSAAEVVGRQTPALWHDAGEVTVRAQDLSVEFGRTIEPGFEVFVTRARLGQPDENEWTFIRKDGSRFPVLLSATALKNGAGEVTGYVGVIADITERRRSEEKLMDYLREVSEFRMAIDEHAIVSIADPQGRIIYANDRFVAISKYNYEELIGQDHRILNSGLHSKEFFRQMWETIKRGGVWKGEVRNRAKDGSFYWVESTMVPFMDADNQPRQFVAIRTDVTARRVAEEKLRQSEEHFRLMVDGVQDYAMFMLDTKGRVAGWNAGAQRIKGYKAEEIIGHSFSKFYPPEAVDAGKPEAMLQEALACGRVQDEGMRVRKDGSRFYATVVITAVRNAAGELVGFSKITRDISEQWEAAERLRTSEERFRSAFGDAPIGMALVNPEGRWLRVNRALCAMIGYAETELLLLDFQRVTHPDDLQTDLDHVHQLLAGEIDFYQMEKRYIHKAGHEVPVMLSVSLVRDGEDRPLYFVSQVEDITERKLAAGKIASSLREKEALLREIHHRVKNNMQVISSILQLQAGYIKDSPSLEVFKDCQGRIRTMALIHEKLYRSEGLAQIDFKDYLESLVGLLFRSQTSQGVQLRHEFKVDRVTLDVDTAIPLGLIANELVSNCLKHAFTGRTTGLVRIGLTRINGNGFQLLIQDDGNGLPAGFDPDKTGSLGVRLIKILSSQIKCRLEYGNDGGAGFTITRNDN